jgi:hypothetical protein
MSTLFDIPEQHPQKPNSTCRDCVFRQRWKCGGSIIQYCGITKSNRTFNKLKKIKVTNPSCDRFQKIIK